MEIGKGHMLVWSGISESETAHTGVGCMTYSDKGKPE